MNPDPLRESRRVPLPGLPNPESQLGVPLLVRGELVGVLCLESEVPYRFHEDDKASIELLGSYLAIAIQNMQLQEQSAELADAPSPEAAPAPLSAGVSNRAASAPSGRSESKGHDVAYYSGDECILVDGEYLVRGLPARILWRLLKTREATGRDEFTNRELRLDKSLNLPEWKDNLESRLILLRRRLEQKCPTVRIVPRSRGRFVLNVESPVRLIAHN